MTPVSEREWWHAPPEREIEPPTVEQPRPPYGWPQPKRPFRAHFRSLFLAALVAIVPGGIVGALIPALGTFVFLVVFVVAWVVIDEHMT